MAGQEITASGREVDRRGMGGQSPGEVRWRGKKREEGRSNRTRKNNATVNGPINTHRQEKRDKEKDTQRTYTLEKKKDNKTGRGGGGLT